MNDGVEGTVEFVPFCVGDRLSSDRQRDSLKDRIVRCNTGKKYTKYTAQALLNLKQFDHSFVFISYSPAQAVFSGSRLE